MTPFFIAAATNDDDDYDYDYEDDEDPAQGRRSYCPSCYEKVNLLEYLGPVILDIDQPVPHDYDKWKQCYRCGRKYATSEVKRESKISDVVDVDEVEPGSDTEIEPVLAFSHHEHGKTDTRTRKGKGRLEKFRDKQNMSRNRIKDPDAIAATKKGLKVDNYQEYQIE